MVSVCMKSLVKLGRCGCLSANSNYNDPSTGLPLGSIQSLLEEADADVLLLYDCCYSATATTFKTLSRGGGVTEVILLNQVREYTTRGIATGVTFGACLQLRMIF